MMIHEITEQVGRHKKRKRIGRGRSSGHGKTSGRGHKGAGSRAGYTYNGGQLPFFRRIPKRGFNNAAFAVEYQIINVSALDKRFEDGEVVDPASLAARGLIRDPKGLVKILGNGELATRLEIKAHHCTKGARAKVEGAGGSLEILERTKWTRQGKVAVTSTGEAEGDGTDGASDASAANEENAGGEG